MMKEEFIEFLKQKKKIVDEELDRILERIKTSPIYPAISYSIKSGGKRLRPVLLMASYSSFSEENEKKTLPFAVGIELIHTYSLIHDDLPAMDNADTRRGKPSLHKVFGEDLAILSGDALLTLAFEVMSSVDTIKPELTLKCINEVAKNAGIEGMVGGQVMDVMTSPDETDEELIYYIHSKKTGALIKTALKIGVILAERGEKEISVIEKFGEKVGLSYQILDDIEDARKGTEDEDRLTFPKMFGIEKSKEIASNLLNEAQDVLKELSLKNNILFSFVEYLKSWLS
ncbi:MAG: polyprenyl synthetase family protein [Caldisericia bacterium]|nr:polyprenyl synthetase family protein [Caldisericia bacterium]